MEQIVIRPLGVRGAAPISGPAYCKYGGATSCILLQIGGEAILLDAGTGLLTLRRYLSKAEKSIHILLSHPHLDHVEGLRTCPVCFEADAMVEVHAVPRGGLSALQQVETFLSPPLWPVGVEAFSAAVTFSDIVVPTFSIGHVKIDVIDGSHPGGCTLFRLTYNGQIIIYATDFEQNTGADDRLCAFAQDCDLLLCDGEYTKDELSRKRGFGHSTWNFTAQLGARCGAKKTKIIHHSLFRTDSQLDAAAEAIRLSYPTCSFAHAGEDIFI